MKFSRKTVGANLPEEVIDVQAARPALPAFAPLRQVEIDRLDAKRASRNLLFKRRTVIFAGEDGDVVSLLDESQHPVPADGGLRTFVRLTCVGRQKNLHDRESCKGAIVTSNNFTIHSDAELMNVEKV